MQTMNPQATHWAAAPVSRSDEEQPNGDTKEMDTVADEAISTLSDFCRAVEKTRDALRKANIAAVFAFEAGDKAACMKHLDARDPLARRYRELRRERILRWGNHWQRKQNADAAAKVERDWALHEQAQRRDCANGARAAYHLGPPAETRKPIKPEKIEGLSPPQKRASRISWRAIHYINLARKRKRLRNFGH